MEHLSNDHKEHSNSHKTSHKLWDEKKAFPFEFLGKSMEAETTTWSEFPNGRKAIVEQILVSEERNLSKSSGLWESQSRI